MAKKIFIFFISLSSISLLYSNPEYKFRLTLKDKGETIYTVDKPEEFLSQKAIERRIKHNIRIDQSDLPISAKYLQEIEKTGAIIVAKSKWNQTVAVHCTDSIMRQQLENLPFVKKVELAWKSKSRRPKQIIDTVGIYIMQEPPLDSLYYGYAYDNIKIIKGDSLHAKGFTGKGMTIGVIDAGFNNYPKIEYMDNINLMGYKNFVYDKDCLFRQDNEHGTNVISCIATNKPHYFVGTAPDADFWILGSEDSSSEYPIEEDYWASAIEFADSVGIDVVNSSLGYTIFDAPAISHTKDGLDGKTALITRSADMASKKGILLVISAGNSGNKKWGKISAPADAEDVLTVGAIRRDSVIAEFSSLGLTADLRIKPDVVALGSGSVVIDDKGQISYKSGTSFSSPIMCGAAVCLWQAFPTLANYELIDIIRQSANQYDDPGIRYGFGIPDMDKAMIIAEKFVEIKKKRVTQ